MTKPFPKEPKKKRGRPLLGLAPRLVVCSVRLAPEEHAQFLAAAEAEGISLSRWLIEPRRAELREKK